jgi:glyoxylase-like metal-dependent hydrolase (beta-lactamase superfamily II)
MDMGARVMRVTPLVASRFVSDGGAMFGLVPKPIWSKLLTPDERNGIAQNANVLFVELEDGRCGLVDTGCGDPARFSDRELELHGMTREWPLMENLPASADAIDFVVLTHLHWDHAGGVGPHFAKAVYYVHQQEWEDATSGDPLLYKSYPADTIAPLRDLPADRLCRVEGEAAEILPGVWLRRSGGHTRGHCVVHLQTDELIYGGRPVSSGQLLFMGDVCPTRHHLRMVFQTAYDTYPLETRSWKRQWLPRAAAEGILLCFDHDPHIAATQIASDPRHEYLPIAGTEK